MFQLEDLHEYSCATFNMYFVSCEKFKSDNSVFKLPFKNQVAYFAEILHDKFSCSDFFIALYWMTFILGIIGFLETCNEMIRVFNDEYYVPMTFGNRTYEYVKLKFRRHARICGLALNLKLFVGLLYGLARNRTSYILPWIVIYGIVLPMEIIYWCCDVYKNRNWKLSPIRYLLILSIRWALTLHIMMVMKRNK